MVLSPLVFRNPSLFRLLRILVIEDQLTRLLCQYITFRAEIIPQSAFLSFLPAEELEKKERKKERKERKEVEVKLLERPNAIIPKDLSGGG